jgi:hypothetical protein
MGPGSAVDTVTTTGRAEAAYVLADPLPWDGVADRPE